MRAQTRLLIVAIAMLIIGGAVGYITGQKNSDTQLAQMVHSLAFAQEAKETASCTRLLEGLRDGKMDLVANRLEVMLDTSLIDIGIMNDSFGAPKEDASEAVNRSLCLARNYRQLYPHRPADNLLAKYYDAALAMKAESK
jgi:hypothetical protein